MALPFFGFEDTSNPAQLLGNADTMLTAANTVINNIPKDLPTTLPYYGTSALINWDSTVFNLANLLTDPITEFFGPIFSAF